MDTKKAPTKHPLRQIWAGIKQRCTNPSANGYKLYGGRGISFCEEFSDFKTFVALVEGEIGPRPSKKHSIDRIENNGNYEPKNIRWATQTQQLRNFRGNRLITHNEKTQCLTAWADELGTSAHTLKNRIDKLNWSVSKALDTPFLTPKRISALAQTRSARTRANAPVGISNTNGMTLKEFIEKAFEHAIHCGATPKPERYGKKFPFDKRFAWEAKLILGEMIEINPDKGVYARMPRGYRFACGQEAFSDLSNVLY